MPTHTFDNSKPAICAANMSVESLNDRLAEAARYAVLNRLMPVLRHDMSGAMQPVRMLLMVLEKRLQAADPDLQTIAKNVMSISTLSKQASVNCLDALGWIASSQDTRVSLHSGVDEIAALLSMELSCHALTLVNGIEDEAVSAPQTFLRCVFVGALLAFCDQYVQGGILRVTFKPVTTDSDPNGHLHLMMVTDVAVRSNGLPDSVRKYRLIDWADVQAMAESCGVQIARGNRWMTVGLPTP